MATLRVTPKPGVARMKAAQIAKPGAEFEIVDRQIPELDAGQVERLSRRRPRGSSPVGLAI